MPDLPPDAVQRAAVAIHGLRRCSKRPQSNCGNVFPEDTEDARAALEAAQAVVPDGAISGRAVMIVRQHLINNGCTIPVQVIREALEAAAGGPALSPTEGLALKVARAQLLRGENPPVNTTAVLVLALDRLTGGRS
jgi:hypothetical protein